MRRMSLGFALLFLFQLGASAPKSSVDPKRSSPISKATKTAPATQKSFSSVATPQGLGDQIVKYFEGKGKTGKELMMEKGRAGAVPKVAPKPVLPRKPAVRSAVALPVKPGYVPPPPMPRPSVPQIRQEIQQILDLNKLIKSVQVGRSVQLQRVQEQARIHQKILNELEVVQKQTDGQKAFSKSALLAQEKLRIIHEETQRNAKMMEDLKEMPAGAVSKPAEKVKAVAS